MYIKLDHAEDNMPNNGPVIVKLNKDTIVKSLLQASTWKYFLDPINLGKGPK